MVIGSGYDYYDTKTLIKTLKHDVDVYILQAVREIKPNCISSFVTIPGNIKTRIPWLNSNAFHTILLPGLGTQNDHKCPG